MTAADRAALLVIDMQRGAFDGVRCAPIDEGTALLTTVGRLLHAARTHAVPVVFVQHLAAEGGVLAEGSPQAELMPALQRQDGEPVITNRQGNAFEATRLGDVLRASGAQRLVVCGLQSERCVAQTTRAALGGGYRVTLVRDGHGTWAGAEEPASAIQARVEAELAALGATLARADDVIAHWP